VLHAQARTQALPWLTVWQPENFIEINAQDAATLGVETYDQVRVSSPSYTSGVIGRAKVTEALRPGVVAISHSFGHWQLGSRPWYEDSVIQSSDSTRSLGVQPNVLMQLDPYLGDVTLQDKIGCSASFYDTWVKIEKV
jgi:anaerobic selenocysteine-containing dehydrogenase